MVASANAYFKSLPTANYSGGDVTCGWFLLMCCISRSESEIELSSSSFISDNSLKISFSDSTFALIYTDLDYGD